MRPRSVRNACRVGRLERGDLELDLRAHRHRRASPSRDEERRQPGAFAARSTLAAAADVGFVEIDHDQQRLGRQQLKPAQPPEIVAGEAERAQRLAVLERGLAARASRSRLLLELGGLVLLEILLDPLEPPFDDAEVGEDQFVFHRLRVARRIDRSATGCGTDGVAKRAHDVHERVGVLVAGDVDQRRGAGAAGRDDVGELDGRGHALLAG